MRLPIKAENAVNDDRRFTLVPRKMMNRPSSFEHRIVDGHGAAFVAHWIEGLPRHPAMLWMGR